MTNPTTTNALVRTGYDQIATAYAASRHVYDSTPYLEAFAQAAPKSRTILDAGCGVGVPIDSYLVDQGFAVNGIDISPQMITLAQKNVPEAFYEIKDINALEENEYCVDGIVSYYALFHTPRETHLATLQKFASFMPSGGPLLITMGVSDWEGVEDFHGTPMFWSQYDAEMNIDLVHKAGFHITEHTIDRAAGEQHLIILATL